MNGRLGALDALGRGVANLRGNPELVAVSVVGAVAVFGVILLALLPWFSAVGIDPGWLVDLPKLTDFAAWTELATVPSAVLARFGTGLLAFAVGLTLSSIVYCWYVGGMLGVIVAGDAQAPVGSGRDPDLFRTWIWPFFVLEANRLTWKVLLYLSIFLGILCLITLAFVGLIVAATLLATRSGAGIGLAVGCGGLLPLFFLFVATFAAMSLGQADLPRADGTARTAVRLGYQVLGRRLAAVAALIALMMIVAIALGLVLGGVGAWVFVALEDSPVALWSARVAFWIVQSTLSAVLQIAFLAAFVALARAERTLEEAPAT